MSPKLSALALLLTAFLLVGCSETTPAEPETTEETAAQTPAAPQGTTGNSGVQVHTGGAGGIAPVTGTENLQGSGGGGVNQAAKSQAQKAAAQAGGSSLDQLGDY